MWVIVAVLAVGLCASLFFRDTLHGAGAAEGVHVGAGRTAEAQVDAIGVELS